MSLSDLASIGTLVSSAAVLVSLIYLGLQMRQNAKHTRALIHQGRIERIIDIQLRTAEPAMAAAVIASSGREPTPEAVRRHQFERYCWATFMSLQDSFDQHAEGLLGDEQFEGFRRGVAGVMSDEGVRDFWRSYGPGLGDSRFAMFVDEVIAGLPQSASGPAHTSS